MPAPPPPAIGCGGVVFCPAAWEVEADFLPLGAFTFFFSNSLLSFTPVDPRIRLRFQTLLPGCPNARLFLCATFSCFYPVNDFPDGSLATGW